MLNGDFINNLGKGDWNSNGVQHFLGVSFKIEGGNRVYGWIRVKRLTGSPFTGEVIDWAYEDDGTAIEAGAVPEPLTGLALLALGAAGIARYRKVK